MEMKELMDMKRLRDLLITVLGLWLMMSPRVLHFAGGHVDAVWNTWVLGAAIILITAVSRYLLDERNPWEDMACAALGLWLMVSPWVLGFAAHETERFQLGYRRLSGDRVGALGDGGRCQSA